MSLHEELQRIAGSVSAPHVDHSVWDRGRSLRRRDRLVTSAVVLVMVLTIGGLAALVTGPPISIAPAGDTVPEGAVPSRIEDVPAEVTGPLEGNEGLGRASAAFMSANGTPVVIGATDGRYHLLDLPGLVSPGVIALSPSGDRLAYVSESSGETAVSVWELLRTESSAAYQLGRDVEVSALAWSPDASWLAYSGVLPSGRAHTGRMQYPEGDQLPGPAAPRGFTGLAVSNDGLIAAGTQAGGLVIGTRSQPDRIAESDGLPAGFSPDGKVLALETRIPAPLSSSWQVDSAKALRHPFPADTIGAATVRPMGWPDDRLQLLLVQESLGDDAELVVTTPMVDQTSTWRRRVGSIDAAAAATVSIAVDLIPELDATSAQPLTHDFGDPDWPGQRDISWLIGLGVAGALSVLYGLRWLWRRRTLRRTNLR